IQPLQRCTLALAGGLAAERAGDLDLARQRYREAADAGDPFELSCLLADQAARALGAPHPP
ncbi:MAG: hypothetical protein KC731_06975, partial [Myxococcales bacterium]|nr:hypothetical protein [Myxococcales bacterium]